MCKKRVEVPTQDMKATAEIREEKNRLIRYGGVSADTKQGRLADRKQCRPS
jgi:hypothetical protein